MTPFSTPTLAVVDTLRLLVAGSGFVLTGIYLTRRWPTTRDHRERARALGLALALFVLASSRLTNLGGPVVWQLWASIAVFGLVAYSVPGRRRWTRE